MNFRRISLLKEGVSNVKCLEMIYLYRSDFVKDAFKYKMKFNKEESNRILKGNASLATNILL